MTFDTTKTITTDPSLPKANDPLPTGSTEGDTEVRYCMGCAGPREGEFGPLSAGEPTTRWSPGERRGSTWTCLTCEDEWEIDFDDPT